MKMIIAEPNMATTVVTLDGCPASRPSPGPAALALVPALAAESAPPEPAAEGAPPPKKKKGFLKDLNPWVSSSGWLFGKPRGRKCSEFGEGRQDFGGRPRRKALG